MYALVNPFPWRNWPIITGSEFAERRAARLLRMRFKAMAFVTLGLTIHRHTLLHQVVAAARVRKTIDTLRASAADRALTKTALRQKPSRPQEQSRQI